MSEEALIRARGLSRRYLVGKEPVDALAGVDLEVDTGEFVALVGPSGSGKSTLLNLLGGLDRPSGGEIWVGDLELGKASDKRLVRYRREQVGFIFQSFNLLPTRTAVENVEVPLMLAGVDRRRRSRVANSSVSPSRVPWPTTRCSCWRTSLQAISTQRPEQRFWRCCRRSWCRGSAHWYLSHTTPVLRVMQTVSCTCSTAGFNASRHSLERRASSSMSSRRRPDDLRRHGRLRNLESRPA